MTPGPANVSERRITGTSPSSHFLIYQAEDGRLKIDVGFDGETVWLTQQRMAALFQTSKQNIGQHLRNIFAEGDWIYRQ